MESTHWPSRPLAIGGWTLDPASQRLVHGEQRRPLNPKEMGVLGHLLTRAPAPVTTRELLDDGWPDAEVNDHVVHDVIGRLRKKLGDDARRPAYIETIPKRGYRLIAPVDARDVTAGPLGRMEVEARASEVVSRAILEFNRLAIENPETNRILVQGMGSISRLSAYDRNRFNALANVLFYNLQKAFYSLGTRCRDAEAWRGQVRSLKLILENPAFRHRWEQLKPFLGVSFRQFVEDEVLGSGNRREQP